MRAKAKSSSTPYPIWIEGEYITEPPIRPKDGAVRPTGHYIDKGGYPGANVYEVDINTMCRQTDAADRFGKPIYEQDILLYETAEEIGYFIVQDLETTVDIVNGEIIEVGDLDTENITEECPYLLSGRVVRNRLDMSLSDMGKLIFVCDVGNVISENKESLSSNKAAIYVYNKNCAIYEDENIKKLDDLPKYVEHSGYKILKQSGRKYFVSYLYSAKTDWTYVSFFPYSDIYGQVQTVRTLLILGFLAVFTALVFFMKKLSVVIVSPLEHLTDSMQIVENGDFQGAREMLTNTDRQDEIGTLSREFRTMLETVDTLIHENYEKQLLLKDTKYKMLRAQINPHFLYNTLNVIHWMIRAKRNEEAGRMIVELGDILHYSFSQTPYAIISDEIKMVKSYIKIQQSRYQDRIKFEIFTEGALDKYIMPRMILQPLVENAISYGAEVSLDICTITVSVRENADAIVMEVIDDGVGMSEEELEAVRSYTFKPKGHGIGLKNISERLKMDDENSIFYIDSVSGKGTNVTIKLHKRAKGDQDV